MKKPGRNDPCPCGSGKKFKKCCESKMLGGRFQATKINSSPQAPGLASLFQSSTAHLPKKTTPPETPPEEESPPEPKPEDPKP